MSVYEGAKILDARTFATLYRARANHVPKQQSDGNKLQGIPMPQNQVETLSHIRIQIIAALWEAFQITGVDHDGFIHTAHFKNLLKCDNRIRSIFCLVESVSDSSCCLRTSWINFVFHLINQWIQLGEDQVSTKQTKKLAAMLNTLDIRHEIDTTTYDSRHMIRFDLFVLILWKFVGDSNIWADGMAIQREAIQDSALRFINRLLVNDAVLGTSIAHNAVVWPHYVNPQRIMILETMPGTVQRKEQVKYNPIEMHMVLHELDDLTDKLIKTDTNSL